MADTRFDDLALALAPVLKSGRRLDSIRRDVDWITSLHQRAQLIPGGFVKRIVWTVEDGYPAHSAGYTQWTLRPYYQGYGCDGTTDDCVHYIGFKLCQSLGIDYAAAYAKAYTDTTLDEAREMFSDDSFSKATRDETILPELPPTKETVALLLSDLYQLNNRSFCEVLVELFSAKGFDVEDFCLTEGEHKANYLASLQRLRAAA